MIRWFYAVMAQDDGCWWNAAARARTADAAKADLLARYPFARIHSLERGGAA